MSSTCNFAEACRQSSIQWPVPVDPHRSVVNTFSHNCSGVSKVQPQSRCCREISEYCACWHALVGSNKRNLTAVIWSDSCSITPKNQLKKDRMSELATWHQSRFSPSAVIEPLASPFGLRQKVSYLWNEKAASQRILGIEEKERKHNLWNEAW